MPDDEWDVIGEKRKYRWVWNGPGGQQHVGPTLHRSKAEAVRAGKEWLAKRGDRR